MNGIRREIYDSVLRLNSFLFLIPFKFKGVLFINEWQCCFSYCRNLCFVGGSLMNFLVVAVSERMPYPN